jgi:hypothetical protein
MTDGFQDKPEYVGIRSDVEMQKVHPLTGGDFVRSFISFYGKHNLQQRAENSVAQLNAANEIADIHMTIPENNSVPTKPPTSIAESSLPLHPVVSRYGGAGKRPVRCEADVR